MSHSRETPQPENPGQALSYEAIHAQLDMILRNTAEHLEAFSEPDEKSREILQAEFGTDGKGIITASRTISNGESGHTIAFLSSDSNDRSFVAENLGGDDTSWSIGKRWLTSHGVLRRLDREWPYGDSNAPERIKINELAQTKPTNLTRDLTPESLFDAIDLYSHRKDTGEKPYDMSWYHKGTEKGAHFDTSFGILGTEGDSFRHVWAAFTIEDSVDKSSLTNDPEEDLPADDARSITYTIRSDEIGDITIRAFYRDPTTNEKVTIPTELNEAVIDTLVYALAGLVTSRTNIS